jgi:hypothetical protein
VQFSATSHTPADDRQTVADDVNASDGHAADEPVQLSSSSHTPADERQTVADETKASPGHVAPEPVQFSATSHTPADDRHPVAEDMNASDCSSSALTTAATSGWSATCSAIAAWVSAPALRSSVIGRSSFDIVATASSSAAPATGYSACAR